MKKIIAIIVLVACCLSLFACQGPQGEKGEKGDPGESGIIAYEGTEGLDFYPFKDGSCGVMAGKAKYLEEVVIPSEYNGNKVKYILQYAFSMSTNLKSVVIPEGVTTLEVCAFWGCTSLESVIIPSSVTEIYPGAFSECTSLSKIQFAGTVQQWSSINFITERVLVEPGRYSSGEWNISVPATEVVCSDGTVSLIEIPEGYIKPTGTFTILGGPDGNFVELNNSGEIDISEYKYLYMDVIYDPDTDFCGVTQSSVKKASLTVSMFNASIDIPEGYIKPTGTLVITSENIADYSIKEEIDISAYKYLVISIPVFDGFGEA